MESLFDIIEFVPDSPIVFPEWPKESLGFAHKCGFYKYLSEEWKDIAAVKKDWYFKAEYFSGCWMHEGANNYVSNPSVDYDISKIIFAGKEHSTKFISEAKDAWYNDMVNDLEKINQSTDIDSVFLKDLDKKNVRFFVWKVLSKKVN
jgi:hypothetical protein